MASRRSLYLAGIEAIAVVRLQGAFLPVAPCIRKLRSRLGIVPRCYFDNIVRAYIEDDLPAAARLSSAA